MNEGGTVTFGVDAYAELHHLVWARLIPGFTALDAIEADVRDWAEDRQLPAEEPVVQAHMLWQERLAEQQRWSDTGDYDRLRAAFQELAADGILGRMNFRCCTRCAARSIGWERTPTGTEADVYGFREWGHVHFHEEDAESLADEEPSLRLRFGSFRSHPQLPEERVNAPGPRTTRLLREQIVGALAGHGLRADDRRGDCDSIVVRIDDWRKPLPGSVIAGGG